MHSQVEAFARLESALGAEQAGSLLRRLTHLPGALDWIREPAVLQALIGADTQAALPALVTLAAAGSTRIESPGEWGPSTRARREALLASPEAGQLDPQDVRILAGDLLAAEASGGAAAAMTLIASHDLDWRGPLGCAWTSLRDPGAMTREAFASANPARLELVLAALRANLNDEQTANMLRRAAGNDLPILAARLIVLGEHDLASAVARDPSDSDEGALESALEVGWQTGRRELAEVIDAIAEVAERSGDSLVAEEARKQALSLSPSDHRLAAAAVGYAVRGDAAKALDLLPADSQSPTLRFALGAALLSGGAADRARSLLTDAALAWLEDEPAGPEIEPSLASHLAALGEVGLAVRVMAEVVRRRPADSKARVAYAQLLVDTGDPAAGRDHAILARLLDPALPGTRRVEAEALRELGQPHEAFAIWSSVADNDNPADWRKSVDLALRIGSVDEARSLLDVAPAGLDPVEATILEAKVLVVGDQVAEAVALLGSAAGENPSEGRLWIELADLQESQGEAGPAGESLHRGAQLAPNSATLRAHLARWLRLQGRLSEAAAAAAGALEIDPAESTGHFEAGSALVALGQAEAAVDHLWKAHRANPASIGFRVALAEALEAAGDLDSARALVAFLPENAPAEAWLLSGRLSLETALSNDPGAAPTAVGHLMRARRLGVRHPDLHYWMGKALDVSGEPDRAVESYRQFLASAPAGSIKAREASLGCASCLISIGKTQEAIGELSSLRAQEGDRPEILAPLADAYLQASLPTEASEAAQALLRTEPSHRKGLQVLSRAARQTGDWTPAAAALETACRADPDDPDLLADAAEAALRSGARDPSRQFVARSLAVNPAPSTRRRLAQVLIEIGEPDQALDVIETAVASGSDDASTWVEVADIAERAKRPKSVLRALGRAAEIEPDQAVHHSRLADALWRSGRRAEAIGSWQKAFELESHDPQRHLELARALVANGEIQPGLDRLALAIEAHPTHAPLLEEAGRAALAHGSVQEAAEHLQAALALDPHDPRTGIWLAEAQLRLGKPDSAEHSLRSLPATMRSATLAAALMAEAHLAMGDLESAKAAVVEARRADPTDVEDRIGLARAELRLGHWKEALTALAPALGSDSEDGRRALAYAILRVLEAGWLYAQVGFATRHAPDPVLPGDSLMEWVRMYLESDAPHLRAAVARWRLIEDPQDQGALQGLITAGADPAAARDDIEALARAHLIRGDADFALDALRRIEPGGLGGSWQAVLAGIAHLDRAQAHLALRAFEDAAADGGIRPLALALTARAASAIGDSESAISALHEALDQWPDEPTWQEDLARLYLDQGNSDAALPHLQAAAELDPDNAEVLADLARTLRANGHVADALGAYERLLPLRPSQAEVWAEAGEMALGLGDRRRSHSYFEKAIDLAPTVGTHRIGAARAALLAGQLKSAKEHAESAASLVPADPEGWMVLADVTARLGEVDTALGLLAKAEAFGEDSGSVRALKSQILIDAGRPSQAVEELRRHLSDRQDDLEGMALMARALEASGDAPGAAQSVEEALRLAPRSASLRVQLARLCRKTGQLDRALDELKNAESLDPLEAGLALELGQVHEARREFDRALEAYRRAVEIEPDLVEPYRRAGAVLKSIKAYSEAGRMLARAAELEPDTKTLQQLAAVRALELVHGATHSMAVTP